MNTTQSKFFTATMYVMYDGKEFPTSRFYMAVDLSEARSLHLNDALTFIGDDEPDVELEGFYFDCGAYLVRPQEVREISATTYAEMVP
jgi:hypothetical protein